MHEISSIATKSDTSLSIPSFRAGSGRKLDEKAAGDTVKSTVIRGEMNFSAPCVLCGEQRWEKQIWPGPATRAILFW
jgi:hypothetical protein